MPNLEELELGYFTSLNIVDPSIGVLKKLTLLSLSGCESLTSLPSSIQYLDSLETILLKLGEISGDRGEFYESFNQSSL